MRRSGIAKFPNSVQLFRFCQKVLMDQKGGKVHDQEVGGILSFNPSDCSHWKRGEKNIRSVFALAKLADALAVEISLVHDLASGAICLDEAYFEYQESRSIQKSIQSATLVGAGAFGLARTRAEAFAADLHKKADLNTAPVYLPEVLRLLPFISAQAVDMMDKLSRILRKKPGHYVIQFKRGELSAQTRLSVALDLARIIFEAERKQFPELGTLDASLTHFEELAFAAALLIPKDLLKKEFSTLDPRKNVVAEAAAMFWVPRSLVCFQLQDIVRMAPFQAAQTDLPQHRPVSGEVREIGRQDTL